MAKSDKSDTGKTATETRASGEDDTGQGAAKAAAQTPEASLDISRDDDGSTTSTYVSHGPAGSVSASISTPPSRPGAAPDLSGAGAGLAAGLKGEGDGKSEGGAQPATDAAATASVANLASVPAMAMATMTQAMAHSTAVLYENAVAQQAQNQLAAQAATMQGVLQIYSLDSAVAAGASQKLAEVGALDKLLVGMLAGGKRAG